MPKILTVTDLVLNDELHIARNDLQNEDGSTTERWFVSVAYKLLSTEGETIARSKTRRLTAGQTTAVKGFITNITADIKTQEGI